MDVSPPAALTRRHVLAAAAGVAAAVTPGALGQSSRPVTQPTTGPATGPATGPVEGGGSDPLDAASTLLGRSYSADEAAQMRPGLDRTATWLPKLRARGVATATEPAETFTPSPPADAPSGGSVAGSVVASLPAGGATVDAGDDLALAFAPVAELAKLLRAGRVTSVRLTDLCLDRLRRHGPALNCVITLTDALARGQAAAADAELAAGRDRGPLHGIPFGVKDLLATRDYPTTYGAAPYREQVFDEDATVVSRLADAGAVLVAKLSMGELALGEVWFGGTTRNPWAPDEPSGGSSAGPCSAVAAGLVPFAVGSETLGSIVYPCSICGTCGLRPTYGRVPRTGAMPLARTLDKLGPIARRVDDLALVLAAIAGPDGHDPTARDAAFAYPPGDLADRPLRVGYDAPAFEALDRAAASGDAAKVARRDLHRAALDRCRERFGDVVAVRRPDDPLLWPVTMMTLEAEAAESFAELADAGRLGELVQQGAGNWPTIFRRGQLLPAVDYLRAQRVRRELAAGMAAAYDGVDAVLGVAEVGSTLALGNLAGYPSCVARLAVVDGRPKQIEFVGRPWAESRLIAVASAFEATVDARDEWPRARWT